MRALAIKLKPASGFSHFIHILLTLLLPGLVYVFIRMSFYPLAITLIVLSKWRMFAVKPRYWPANIRANAVDLSVGISTVLFMSLTRDASWQIVWAMLYAGWLLFIKPKSGLLMVTLQAVIGQLFGLVSLFLALGESPTIVLTLGAWTVCYLSARHFLTSFDEEHSSLFAHTWGYFAAALTWILSHWMLFYGGFFAQPALLLSVIGFSLAGLYYLDETDRLSPGLRRQFVFVMIAVVLVVMIFSDWGDKVV